jgi:tight adherence protein B
MRLMRRDPGIETGLPDVARVLARGTSAGLPLSDALARGADALDGELAIAMRRAAADLRAGHPTRAALRPLEQRPGGVLLVGAIELHHELGGDLVASLAGIAEGERLRLEARAATAQARIAARIVPLAPLGSLLMLAVVAPGAAAALLTAPAGLAIVGIAATVTAVAMVLLRRIAQGAGL